MLTSLGPRLKEGTFGNVASGGVFYNLLRVGIYVA